jgi:hypothetical protein
MMRGTVTDCVRNAQVTNIPPRSLRGLGGQLLHPILEPILERQERTDCAGCWHGWVTCRDVIEGALAEADWLLVASFEPGHAIPLNTLLFFPFCSRISGKSARNGPRHGCGEVLHGYTYLVT